eukprot:767846-Hanusia_phi.AAC.3
MNQTSRNLGHLLKVPACAGLVGGGSKDVFRGSKGIMRRTRCSLARSPQWVIYRGKGAGNNRIGRCL